MISSSGIECFSETRRWLGLSCLVVLMSPMPFYGIQCSCEGQLEPFLECKLSWSVFVDRVVAPVP